MSTPRLHKTHPMVLTAAASITLFSLLGSATVTGLIPTVHSEPLASSQKSAEPGTNLDTPRGRARPSGPMVAGNAATGTPANQALPARSNAGKTCNICGTIESISLVQQDGEGSGLGAIAGGVTGGILGNQIGGGHGKTLMTIIGAGGGAYAGHTIEKKMQSTTSYVVRVRMGDGSSRNIALSTLPPYAVGDRVRVVSGRITSA